MTHFVFNFSLAWFKVSSRLSFFLFDSSLRFELVSVRFYIKKHAIRSRIIDLVRILHGKTVTAIDDTVPLVQSRCT